MRTLLSVFLLGLAPLFAANDFLLSKAKSVHNPTNVQVLLEKNVPEALLEAKGPYYIYDPYNGTKISSGMIGKRFMVHAFEDGIKWGEFFPDIHQIYVVPRSEKSSLLVNGVQYDGGIAIYNINGVISIVNDVDIEDYIKAVLSPRFYEPLDQEAMSAIAIVARTNVYHTVSENKNKYWHIDGKKANYFGSSMVKPFSEVDNAVEETSHIVLTNHDLKPFAAKWTEHCAGKTAPYHKIYRKDGFEPKKGVESTVALYDRKQSEWSFEIPKSRVARLFGLNEVKEINIYRDTESSKTYAVVLKGLETEKQIDFFKFQEKVGKELLESNDFMVASKGDSFVFAGFGKGDGVGLCLYSADILSQKGQDALTILEKFYPESHLVNFSSEPILGNKQIEVQ